MQRRKTLDPLNVVVLRLRREIATVMIFDHAPGATTRVCPNPKCHTPYWNIPGKRPRPLVAAAIAPKPHNCNRNAWPILSPESRDRNAPVNRALEFLDRWEADHVENVPSSQRGQEAARLAELCWEDAIRAGISPVDLLRLAKVI
jgi:hypothetical protein